jgi:hypothetical protein
MRWKDQFAQKGDRNRPKGLNLAADDDGDDDVRVSEVRLSALCLCVWQKFGFSRREAVFTCTLLHKKYYKCTFSAISKEDAATNFISIQHKKCFPVNFDGSLYDSIRIKDKGENFAYTRIKEERSELHCSSSLLKRRKCGE